MTRTIVVTADNYNDASKQAVERCNELWGKRSFQWVDVAIEPLEDEAASLFIFTVTDKV